MKYKEEIGDLFDVPKDYYFAHCISADFVLGAGIAVQFDKRFNMRQELKEHYPDYIKKYDDPKFLGGCILIKNVFNLVTKKYCYNKPTLDSMNKAIQALRKGCEKYKVKKLAMPLIGCGLDQLRWIDVAHIINFVFYDTDIEILVRKLE